MEMNEVGRLLPENNVANTTGKRVALGLAGVLAKTAVGFAKDVMPDSLKQNYQDREKPVPPVIIIAEDNREKPVPPVIIIAEDNRKIASVRAELKTLMSIPVNKPEQVMKQSPQR